MLINSIEQIRDLTRGAVFLGTGGGGDPYIGQLMLQQELRKGNKARVISASELADDAQVVSVAGIGAPSVLVEHLQGSGICQKILDRMEQHLGRKVDALIPAEVGGLNSILPMALGAETGLPIVDGDGMGRAFPHLEMVTFSVYGSRACPVFITNELGDMVIIEHTTTDRKVEDVARAVTASLGAMVYSSLYPMSGAEVKQRTIHGSLSLCLEIGAGIRESREKYDDPFDGLMKILHRPDKDRHAKILFDGKITDITRETRDGWHFATVKMQALDGSNDTFELDVQNEYLLARRNDQVSCIVPDLITTLDRETAEPLTAEQLKYGQRLKVVGYSADPIMRRPECLKVFGPSEFGLKHDFVPMEQL